MITSPLTLVITHQANLQTKNRNAFFLIKITHIQDDGCIKFIQFDELTSKLNHERKRKRNLELGKNMLKRKEEGELKKNKERAIESKKNMKNEVEREKKNRRNQKK